MRLAFLLATIGLLIAPLRPAAAQRTGPRQPKRPESPPSDKPQLPPAPPSPRQPPEPGLPPAIPGQAPSIPTGMTAEQAAAPVPETGTITAINIQGNRRVEADAIRAALPLRPGDTFDKRKLKDVLLAVWRMGYFNDVKLDVSAVPPPGTGYQLTILVSEKPAVHDIKLEGTEELSREDLKDTFEIKQFQILDQESVRKTAKKIQEKYVEKGIFLAVVNTRI